MSYYKLITSLCASCNLCNFWRFNKKLISVCKVAMKIHIWLFSFGWLFWGILPAHLLNLSTKSLMDSISFFWIWKKFNNKLATSTACLNLWRNFTLRSLQQVMQLLGKFWNQSVALLMKLLANSLKNMFSFYTPRIPQEIVVALMWSLGSWFASPKNFGRYSNELLGKAKYWDRANGPIWAPHG